MSKQTLTLKEIHNNGSSAPGTYDAILDASSNTTDLHAYAIIQSSVYKSIFGQTSRVQRRMPILKIKYENGSSKRILYRLCNTKGVKGITKNDIGLTFISLWEMGVCSSVKNGINVTVTKGTWLPFFWFHPNHAARITTRIGMISLIFTFISMIVTICC